MKNKHLTPILYWNLKRMLEISGFNREKLYLTVKSLVEIREHQSPFYLVRI